MSELDRKDDSMPEAISTFQEKVFKIAQEMDNNHATEFVILCPISELSTDYDMQLPRELDRRLILVHGNAWIKCQESEIHSRGVTVLRKSIQNSEYFKRDGLEDGACRFNVIRLHTCGRVSEKIADLAFEKQSSSGLYIRHVYGEEAFHNESPTLLLEEMVNALSPYQTFEISVGMKIRSVNRDIFEIDIRTFVRGPLNFPAVEDVDQLGAMERRSIEIQRAKGTSYNPKEAARLFHPSRVRDFLDDFGVLQVDYRLITVIRGIVHPPVSIVMTLGGDTFTLTSRDFSIMHDYTLWWDRVHGQGQ